MKQSKYYVVGVMSGTSLDGIDLVYVQFTLTSKWEFNIIHAQTMSYTSYWKTTLETLVALTPEALLELDKAYTTYLGSVIKDFIQIHQISRIDAICSHGHTAWHKPEQGETYQIGNRNTIANYLKQKVVCDFRVQDVTLGGQGAPLVPIGDALLFSEYEFCLNLGGFANISTQIGQDRIAYDICPVNIVFNHYTRRLGLDFDADGAIAASGTIVPSLLEALNALEFYKVLPPKSLGLEWVQDYVIPLIERYKLTEKDILRTFSEHVAIQIATAMEGKTNATVLVTGGGAYNRFLMDRIKALSSHAILCPTPELIEFKEALIFGYLGVLKLRNEVNCLKSVTGAIRDHRSGKIYEPQH